LLINEVTIETLTLDIETVTVNLYSMLKL